MTNEALEKSERDLKQGLAQMGRTTMERLRLGVSALQQQDLARAREVVAGDEGINRQCWMIEEEAMVAIARHQPVAGDLRRIVAVMQVAVELERIADYAANIARLTLERGAAANPIPTPLFPELSEKALAMLDGALHAFLEGDEKAVRRVAQSEPGMDRLQERVVHELLLAPQTEMEQKADVMRLVWIAHYLERVADRATNIAERTLFALNGEETDLNPHD